MLNMTFEWPLYMTLRNKTLSIMSKSRSIIILSYLAVIPIEEVLSPEKNYSLAKFFHSKSQKRELFCKKYHKRYRKKQNRQIFNKKYLNVALRTENGRKYPDWWSGGIFSSTELTGNVKRKWFYHEFDYRIESASR